MSRRLSTPDESGEGYLASVSDLMAGLIFVFVITLAVFSLRLSEARELQKQKAEEAEEKVEELTSAKEVRERILLQLKERLESVDIRVEVVPEQGVLRLSEKGIYFPSGSAHPKLDYENRVGELARVVREVLPCFVDHRAPKTDRGEAATRRPAFCSVQPSLPYECQVSKATAKVETLLVEGHTDAQPVGSNVRYKDNLELSSMRAAEVFRMIVACEPDLPALRNQDNLEVLSVSGYGATRLVHTDDPLHEENRRIDLRFLMELPSADQMKEIPQSPEPEREVRERYES